MCRDDNVLLFIEKTFPAAAVNIKEADIEAAVNGLNAGFHCDSTGFFT